MEIQIKPPQYSMECEQDVLGYIMLHPDVLDNGYSDLINTSLFYCPQHRLIIQAMRRLMSEGEPVFIDAVIDRLNKMEKLVDAGGAHYVTGLPMSPLDSGVSFNVRAQKLKQMAMERNVRDQAIKVLSSDPPLDQFETVRDLLPGNGFPRTDSGNAEYFASLYGDRLQFDHRRKCWLVFKKHYWIPDKNGEVKRLAKKAARKRLGSTVYLDDLKEKDAEAKHAIRSESEPKIRAMLNLAQAEEPLADSGSNWDDNPWLLGVGNGVVDLKTGELRNGKPEDRISKNTYITFDPDAACPRWTEFIQEITGPEPELIDFLWRAAGYSLSGETSEQVLFLCYGSGANGKTTFLNLLRYILGDYSYNTAFSTLELNRYSTSTHDLANLEGRRLITASETSDSKRLNEARIKAWTGGDDVTARHLYRNEMVFKPVGKLWLATNHKPIVQDDSPGFWRRVCLIPFLQCFEGEKQDRDLERKLKKEAEGILSWAVHGCRSWQQEGLMPPEIVSSATQEYREESDPLSDFIYDCLEANQDSDVAAKLMYQTYCHWTEDQGLKPRDILSQQMFGRMMKEKYPQKRTGQGRFYVGITLKNPTGE